MRMGSFSVVCPACGGTLRDEEERLACGRCGRRYPVVLGIADLRLAPDPYIGLEADRRKGIDLAERCRGLGFREAVEVYYRRTDAVPERQAAGFRRGLAAAPERARRYLELWRSMAGGDAGRPRMLEIGCGTAPLLLAASGRYEAIGVDIAFRWLVMARIRLEEAGVRVPLVCGNAESLPFEPGTFDVVAADSVLEHLEDPPAALREARRVSREDASLFVSTPNRHSLGPDPHSGLWAGGYLPERLTAAYVSRLGGIPPRRRLLSLADLRRTLRAGGFRVVTVEAPPVPVPDPESAGPILRALVRLYGALRRAPPLRWLFLRVGPVLAAVARATPGDPPDG